MYALATIGMPFEELFTERLNHRLGRPQVVSFSDQPCLLKVDHARQYGVRRDKARKVSIGAPSQQASGGQLCDSTVELFGVHPQSSHDTLTVKICAVADEQFQELRFDLLTVQQCDSPSMNHYL